MSQRNAARAAQFFSGLSFLPVAASRRKPSASLLSALKRTAMPSPSGTFNMPSYRCLPSLPKRRSALPSRTSVGLRVTTEIAPAALLRPSRVPCGPFRTSTRSMSLKARNDAPERAAYTPSM